MTREPDPIRPDDKRVTLELSPTGGGKCVLDGQDISNLLRAVKVEASPHPPEVTLRLGSIAVEVQGEAGPELRLDEGTAELLEKFGWTPPESPR